MARTKAAGRKSAVDASQHPSKRRPRRATAAAKAKANAEKTESEPQMDDLFTLDCVKDNSLLESMNAVPELDSGDYVANHSTNYSNLVENENQDTSNSNSKQTDSTPNDSTTIHNDLTKDDIHLAADINNTTTDVNISTPNDESSVTAPPLISSAQMTTEELNAVSFVGAPELKRYFADSTLVCNSCKELGHSARDCEVLLCASCGAIDAHTTRECTVALICYRCGGRGHRSMQCSVKQLSRRQCELCGSSTHPANACPSTWRRYRYISEALFVSPPDLDDDWLRLWCYNCAADTHLGDDCEHPRGHPSRLDNPTAFSRAVYQTGPYWDRVPPCAKVSKTGIMEVIPTRTYAQALPSGMDSVGRLGRERNRRKLDNDHEDSTDGPDWFSARANVNIPARSIDSSRSRRDREKERDRQYPVDSPSVIGKGSSSRLRQLQSQSQSTPSTSQDKEKYSPFTSREGDINNSDQEDWDTLQGRKSRPEPPRLSLPPITFSSASIEQGRISGSISKRGRYDDSPHDSSGGSTNGNRGRTDNNSSNRDNKISFKFPQNNNISSRMGPSPQDQSRRPYTPSRLPPKQYY